LRALYDPADWRAVVQPISDALRTLQRDALVGYILHQMRANPGSAHIDTADKLFEYFLMDVQMDSCMQTSRIRHALSSLQLFIDRCLMNLEPRVAPASINAKQWEWMKRYRVWEAFRKVFLLPENWIEPELRDDKSPFFKEIESELLQSDITEESATTALLNYLTRLEEVAKLEPCGICHVEADSNRRTPAVDHVVARTAGARRKYYYRRYDGSWSPWEEMKLDIEDNPVVPYVWNGRLLVFWVRIIQKGLDKPGKPGGASNLAAFTVDQIPDNTGLTTMAILCFSEYYNGKWQPVKTSDVNAPTIIDQSQKHPQFPFFRGGLQLSAAEQDNVLRIGLDYYDSSVGSFLLYNTHSVPVPPEQQNGIGFRPALTDTREFSSSHSFLFVDYNSGPQTDSKGQIHYLNTVKRQPIRLSSPIDISRGDAVQPRHPTSEPFSVPFLFADHRHVFYVRTRKEAVWVLPDGFGMGTAPSGGKATSLPPLVFKPQRELRVPPRFLGDRGVIAHDPGFIDPAPIQRYVTEDAYISRGIATPAAVVYGDRQIGPSGALERIGEE
jgi:hypothetical protein